MNAQRLKFAWARGARIQWLANGDQERNQWLDSVHNRASVLDITVPLRIHPDDEHLQYGPISQGLIDLVLYGYDFVNHPERDAAEGVFIYLVCQDDKTEEDRELRLTTTHLDRLFYMLMVAELLADDGI